MNVQHKAAAYKELVILGATFLGAGAALSLPGSSLIIERGYFPGKEFTDSLSSNKFNMAASLNAGSKSYIQAPESKNAVNTQGEISPVAAIYVLCDILKEKKINVMFGTEVTHIEKCSDGYMLTVFNIEGLSCIYAKKIIDTTSEGTLHDSINSVNIRKYLNSVIFSKEGEKTPEGIETSYCSLSDRTVFHFEVNKNAGYMDARKSYYDFMKSNGEKLRGWKIAMVSGVFDYLMPETKIEIDENYIWQPSCGYQSLVDAFEAGGKACC